MWRLDKGNLKEKIYYLVSKLVKILEDKYKNDKRLVKNIYIQLYRSITSVWANMSEADVSITDNEFYRIMWICVRELKESQYWIRILRKEYRMNDLKEYENEVSELVKIISSILKNKYL